MRITNLLNKISNNIGSLGSFIYIILIFIISISVILRYFFSMGFTWLQDLYIWTHGILILIGVAYTLNKDKHVRIDLIYRNLETKSKGTVNFLGAIFFGLPICYLLIFKGYEYFFRSFVLNENSKESGGLPNIFILKLFILVFGILLFFEIFNQIIKYIKKKWR